MKRFFMTVLVFGIIDNFSIKYDTRAWLVMLQNFQIAFEDSEAKIQKWVKKLYTIRQRFLLEHPTTDDDSFNYFWIHYTVCIHSKFYTYDSFPSDCNNSFFQENSSSLSHFFNANVLKKYIFDITFNKFELTCHVVKLSALPNLRNVLYPIKCSLYILAVSIPVSTLYFIFVLFYCFFFLSEKTKSKKGKNNSLFKIVTTTFSICTNTSKSSISSTLLHS